MFLCGEQVDELLLDWVDGEDSSENGLDLGLAERNTDFGGDLLPVCDVASGIPSSRNDTVEMVKLVYWVSTWQS
jgi:hypothetical protein